MTVHWKRAALVLLPALALVASLGAAPAIATGKVEAPNVASGPGEGRGPSTAPEASVVLEAQVAAYRAAYPRLSVDLARRAAEHQGERKLVYDDLVRNGDRDFGGAWFDPTTGVLHVAVTNTGAERRALTTAREHGVEVETHRVRRPVAQLEAQAASLRQGTSPVARAARGQVGYDVRTNTVVASVPADQRARLEAEGLPDGVTLVDDPHIATEQDYGCTSRTACDWTIRAGSVLWRGATGNNVCSVGFTGRDSSNRRYTLTAGHCSNGNGVTWGTGTAPIGPMMASINSGAQDAAVVRVTNSWFAADGGGEIYLNTAVNYVAPTVSYIWAGETVCLSANFTNPTGPNRCGVVGTNSDPAVRGMVRVDGLDACGGDSGGGWYWLASSTYRVAYGVHSRSDVGCQGSNGGNRSWFSPIASIRSWAPWLTIETR